MNYLIREFGTLTIKIPIDENLLNNPTLTSNSVTVLVNNIEFKLDFTPDEISLIENEKKEQAILEQSIHAARYIVQMYINCFHDIEPNIKSVLEPQTAHLAERYRFMLTENSNETSADAHRHWNWQKYAQNHLKQIVKQFLYRKLQEYSNLVPDLKQELLDISNTEHFHKSLAYNIEKCKLQDLIILYDKWVNTEHTTDEFVLRQILSLIQY